MKVTIAKALYPEEKGFILDRKSCGEQYIFIHFHTPVSVYTVNGMIDTSGNSFMIVDKYSYQHFISSECALVHDWMHIEGNLDEIMKRTNLSYNTIYQIPNGSFITKLIHEIEAELLSLDKFSFSIIENNTEKLFSLLGRTINDISSNSIAPKVKEALLEFRIMVHKSYQNNWTLSSMASEMHMSRSRFCNAYKLVFGISPKKDLQNIRITRAKQLLLSTDYTVYEIAEMIGYTNEYYFIRKFKEVTGTTPGLYAKAN